VLKSAAAGTASPLDALMMTMRSAAVDDDDSDGTNDLNPGGGSDDNNHSDPASVRGRRAGIAVREPSFPCYRATPSFTAAATSAS
jgi:hypothetical protein